jgi:hypothetical protein
MGCGGGGGAVNQLQQQQQQQQNWTNQAVGQINQAFSGFNQPFYSGVGKAYTNWALPQVGTQYQATKNQLLDKLAGQGIMNSSAAGQAQNALSGALTQAQQGVSNQALAQEQQLQQQVGQEKSNLYAQAQTATNPSALGQQALETAASTSAPSTFAPLGQLFTNFGNQYLAGQNANLYNNFANQYLNMFSNPALFSGGFNSPFGGGQSGGF